jgi:hypothetical protein
VGISFLQNHKTYSLLSVLIFGLTPSLTHAQRIDAETTNELQFYFQKRAETLQNHLSVSPSDQAFYHRFIENYHPLEQGLLPAAWRQRLLNRILALAGVRNLTAAQQAQLNNALDAMGSAGLGGAAASQALQDMANSLGISSADAANLLAQASGDPSLFDGNASVGQQLQNNASTGLNAFNANASNPNNMDIPVIGSPQQVNYASEGPVATVASNEIPSLGNLSMGGMAGSMGQAPLLPSPTKPPPPKRRRHLKKTPNTMLPSWH